MRIAALARLDRGVDLLCRAGLWASAAIVLAIVAVVVLEVAARGLFGTSLFVVEELVGYLMAAFTLLGLAHTFRHGTLLRVEVLYERLSARGRARADVAFDLAAVVFLAILEYQLVRLVVTSHRREVVSVTMMSFPVWIPQAVLAAGGAVLLLTVLNSLVQGLLGPRRA